jgi:hypothetical protein
MLAFGNLGVAAGKVTVQGWLYDVKNEKSPQVLGKQYTTIQPPTPCASLRTNLPMKSSFASAEA